MRGKLSQVRTIIIISCSLGTSLVTDLVLQEGWVGGNFWSHKLDQAALWHAQPALQVAPQQALVHQDNLTYK